MYKCWSLLFERIACNSKEYTDVRQHIGERYPLYPVSMPTASSQQKLHTKLDDDARLAMYTPLVRLQLNTSPSVFLAVPSDMELRIGLINYPS